ncbi:proteinase [Dactylosporangium sucinum]|uniref:Proteinase n=1 Tax=Dactylosporangium sucinum TaxID=1424081 RepID=A0A917UB74_9ACTN|nr:alpha/beta hydrolase [Dactylosporangium sucinum]GGM75065.1 proteinase [Dactylosporangium sucinum]
MIHHRLRRRLAGLVPLLVVAALLGGCIAPDTRWTVPTAGRPLPKASVQPSATSSGVPIAPADWKPCPEAYKAVFPSPPQNVTFSCATVKVPQDWEHPKDSGTFDVALVRGRSTTQRDRVGSLFINPGGPGASGFDYGVYRSVYLPAEVLRRFDVIGFDPRGVGRSSPVKCFSNADLDANFGIDPDPVSDEQFQQSVTLARKLAQSCGTKYGDALRYYSTEQTARDMDALRAAVGESQLTYLGYSYGTLLGAVYAQLFPKNVRALVLDGAVDPTLSTQDSAEKQAAGFELAFNNFATWCRANATSCPIGPDARAVVTKAIADSRTAPVAGKGGRKATAGWVFTAVVSSLYSESSWRELAQAMQDLRSGNADGLFKLADSYAERDPSGNYTNMFDANAAVGCADSDDTPTVEQARALQSQWRQKYPLFGGSLALNLICAQWPGKRDPYPAGAATGSAPIVVIGTLGDPATPYEQAPALAKMLGVGTLVTWKGEGHTAYPKTGCIIDAVNRYLIDLRVPGANLTCDK